MSTATKNWIIVYKDGSWKEASGADAEYRGNDPDFLVAIPAPVEAVSPSPLTLKPGEFLDGARALAAQVDNMPPEAQAVEVRASGSGFRAPSPSQALEADIAAQNLGLLLAMGELKKLVEVSEARGWNKYDACIYCARHRSRGHLEDCALIRAKDAMARASLSGPAGAGGDPETDLISLQTMAHFLGRMREASAGHPYYAELLDGADASLAGIQAGMAAAKKIYRKRIDQLNEQNRRLRAAGESRDLGAGRPMKLRASVTLDEDFRPPKAYLRVHEDGDPIPFGAIATPARIEELAYRINAFESPGPL
jgi:hypothetical protein